MARILIAAVAALIASATAQPLPSEVIEKEQPYGGHPRQLVDVVARPLSTPKPALLIVHGGSWQSGDKRSHEQKNGFFLRQGFAVASMNYRLHPEVGTRQQAEDVAAAAVWLAKNADRYGINPQEIFLVGHEAGAHLVSLVGTDPSLLAPFGGKPADLGGVIALDSGAYDIPAAMKLNTEDSVYGRTLRQVFGANDAVWPMLSPSFMTSRSGELPGFFVAHSENRADVFTQARPFVQNLRRGGAAAIIYEAGGRDDQSIFRFFATENDPLTKAVVNFIRREANLPTQVAIDEEDEIYREIPWSMSFDAAFSADEERPLTGTQVTGILRHEGKLYAGNGQKGSVDDPPRGQIFRLDAREEPWSADLTMPRGYTDVLSLASVRFERDFEAMPVEPASYLLAGTRSRNDVRSEDTRGPLGAGLFIKTPSGTWTKQDIGSAEAPVTELGALAFWRDRLTGVEHVFAAASPAPLGIYRGAFSPGATGGIGFAPEPELIAPEGAAFVGFAVCGEKLYAATGRQIFEREDGDEPRWNSLLDLTELTALRPYLDDLDIYWQRNFELGSFRCDLSQTKPTLAFTALNRAFRYEPGKDTPISELNIASLIKAELGREVHFVQGMNAELMHRSGRDTEEWIGLEVYYDLDYLSALPEFPFWPTGFGKDGWYLVRTVDRGAVSYRLEQLTIPGLDPNLRPLARVTDFERSPFDQDNAVYVGGFAPWFEATSNTAWIARGEL
ncbi:MAG: alpha/beta hydrolase [Parvularcula sp.]|jgi:acetyl esterase/lipase|nr:alpha/beta hydrolase [Parvularcula sp.]